MTMPSRRLPQLKIPFLPRPVRIALWLLLASLLVPYVLTPLYSFGRPVSTVMLWRWFTGQRVERIFVPLDRIAPAVAHTVIVSEDGKFCAHRGVDLGELRQMIAEAEDFEDLRGGSTITQQLAKNLFLWPGRSYVRKVVEFPLALWIDLVLGKRRVMELYLNIAEWGPNGEFGVEAGARRAFGKPAQQLTANEAALLASMLPNPRERDARSPGPSVRRLAGLYVSRAGRMASASACLRKNP